MNPQPMDETRFGALAEAWGGDLRRWPEADRGTGRAFADAHPREAERILFEADALDALLDASPRPAVSADLRDRVLAGAASPGRRRMRGAWPSLTRLLWLGGAGWAAAACAGVVFGTNLGGRLADQRQAEAVVDQAMLSGFDEMEVLG
jgi:hypothetical protein